MSCCLNLTKAQTREWETLGDVGASARREFRNQARERSLACDGVTCEILSHDGIVLDAIRIEREPSDDDDEFDGGRRSDANGRL